MRDVSEVLDALDLAVGGAYGFAAEDSIAEAAMRSNRLRRRGGFLGDVLVIAIAGGTGVGKSSLFNALAGEEIASVSHLRPHTQRAIACIPERGVAGLARLLDDMGVAQRHVQYEFPHLVIVDLPDIDSVERAHRIAVEEILPDIDVVIWTFDPDKYADRLIHEQFLPALVAHQDRIAFVVNKTDLLDTAAAAAIVDDLADRLRSGGFEDPQVFAVAARPPGAGPRGMFELETFLTAELDAKRIALEKLLDDAHATLHNLGVEAGIWGGGSIGFEDKWARDRGAIADELATAPGLGAHEDARCRLEDFMALVSASVGPILGESFRKQFPVEAIADAVDAAAATAGRTSPRDVANGSGWTRAWAAASVLEVRIGEPLRAALRDRARFAATVAEAGVGAIQVKSRLAKR